MRDFLLQNRRLDPDSQMGGEEEAIAATPQASKSEELGQRFRSAKGAETRHSNSEIQSKFKNNRSENPKLRKRGSSLAKRRKVDPACVL